MRLHAFAELQGRLPDVPDDETGHRREEQIEAMFPDICLPSFVAVSSRRPRSFDARDRGRRGERASHDR